jgi:hypothetical protein
LSHRDTRWSPKIGTTNHSPSKWRSKRPPFELVATTCMMQITCMFTKQHVVIVSAATQDYLSDPHCQPATVLRLSDRIEKCKGGDDRWIKKTQPQSRVIFSTRTRPGSRLTISSTSGSQLRVPGRGHGTAGLHSHLSTCVHASSSSFLTRSCKGGLDERRCLIRSRKTQAS